MLSNIDWSGVREWGGFALSALVLLFVAYDLWWKQRPRLRVRFRRFHGSDDLEVLIVNRGGGPLTILDVVFEVATAPDMGLKVGWVPDDGTLPAQIGPFGATRWKLEIENAGTMVLTGVPFIQRFFAIPEAGWQNPRAKHRRTDVLNSLTSELKGQRRAPTPEKPLRMR